MIGKIRSNIKFSLLNTNKTTKDTAINGTIIKLHFIIVFRPNLLRYATPTNIKNAIYGVGVFWKYVVFKFSTFNCWNVFND